MRLNHSIPDVINININFNININICWIFFSFKWKDWQADDNLVSVISVILDDKDTEYISVVADSLMIEPTSFVC